MNKKMKNAIKSGKLIRLEDVLAKLPKKQQKEIEKEARYIVAAMEIRKLRKRLKLTQNDLAKKMKVKRELVSRVESGRQNVTLETLYKIAEATGKNFTFQFK